MYDPDDPGAVEEEEEEEEKKKKKKKKQSKIITSWHRPLRGMLLARFFARFARFARPILVAGHSFLLGLLALSALLLLFHRGFPRRSCLASASTSTSASASASASASGSASSSASLSNLLLLYFFSKWKQNRVSTSCLWKNFGVIVHARQHRNLDEIAFCQIASVHIAAFILFALASFSNVPKKYPLELLECKV